MVDMSSSAVTMRLREAARLLAERGVVTKGVDMSPASVTARLRSSAALSEMCAKLVAIGLPLRDKR